MPGAIVGIMGKQRSGKTLLAYMLAKSIRATCRAQGEELRVYTNLYCPGEFIFVNALTDIPLDLDPKIILIDEIYNGCDAQDYKKLKDISIFINTLGKQNALFIFTTIDANMVYNRIRSQMNACVLVKCDAQNIYYKWVNLDNLNEHVFSVKKCPELFHEVRYDTEFIPLEFDWSMDSWMSKLKSYYFNNYDISL